MTPDVTYRAAGNLILLPIMIFVVFDRGITHHGHDVWKHHPWSLVFVRIYEDSKTFKVVGRPEDRPGCCSLFSEPDGHSIAVEITLAVDLELDFNLHSNEPRIRAAWEERVSTSQLVAVSGKREKSQPSCDGRSDVRRTYLSPLIQYSAISSKWEISYIILVRSYYSVSSKVVESTLHI